MVGYFFNPGPHHFTPVFRSPPCIHCSLTSLRKKLIFFVLISLEEIHLIIPKLHRGGNMLRPYHDLHVSSHDISGYVINRFTGTERKLYRPGRLSADHELKRHTTPASRGPARHLFPVGYHSYFKKATKINKTALQYIDQPITVTGSSLLARKIILKKPPL